MSRPRFEQLPPERKQEILRVAAEEFARSGFHGTSYNQLLARLGIGKGSAYYYFDDKQDLFLTAVRECYLRFFASQHDLPLPTSVDAFWKHADELSLRGLQYMQDDPTSAALLQTFARERGQLDVLASPELVKGVGDTYEQLVRLGQTLGAVRTDLPVELLIGSVQSIAGAFDQWFVTLATPLSASELGVVARYLTTLLRGLLEPR